MHIQHIRYMWDPRLYSPLGKGHLGQLSWPLWNPTSPSGCHWFGQHKDSILLDNRNKSPGTRLQVSPVSVTSCLLIIAWAAYAPFQKGLSESCIFPRRKVTLVRTRSVPSLLDKGSNWISPRRGPSYMYLRKQRANDKIIDHVTFHPEVLMKNTRLQLFKSWITLNNE